MPLDRAIDLDRRDSQRAPASLPSPRTPGEEGGRALVDLERPIPPVAAGRGWPDMLAATASPLALLLRLRARRAAKAETEVPRPAPLDRAHESDVEPSLRWRRAAAWGIDLSILTAACAPPLLLAWHVLPAGPGALATLLPSAAGFAALLGFAYGSLGHALMGATIGKRLLGLQVVGPDGVFPGLARSAARSGLAVLGTAGLGVGVLMALFTRSGRCLHDLVADTVVIRAP